MSDETTPLVVTEAYLYTLRSGKAQSGCFAAGIGFLAALIGQLPDADEWLSRKLRAIPLLALTALFSTVAERSQPCSYVLDEEGIWRVRRLQASKRSLRMHGYRSDEALLARPAQTRQWETQRRNGRPVIVITRPDEVKVTLCLPGGLAGDRLEWDVLQRLYAWRSLPEDTGEEEDEGEVEVHWEEVPEDLKPWV